MALRSGDPLGGIARDLQRVVLEAIRPEVDRELQDLDRRYGEAVREIRLRSNSTGGDDGPSETGGRRGYGGWLGAIGMVCAIIACGVALGFGKISNSWNESVSNVVPSVLVLLVAALLLHLLDALFDRRAGSTVVTGRTFVGISALQAVIIAVAVPVREAVEGGDPLALWPSSLAALVVAVVCALLWFGRAAAARTARQRDDGRPTRDPRAAIVLETKAARAEGRAVLQQLTASEAAEYSSAIEAATTAIAGREVLDRASIRRLQRADWIELRYDAAP